MKGIGALARLSGVVASQSGSSAQTSAVWVPIVPTAAAGRAVDDLLDRATVTLRRALVARYGVADGCDAAAEAIAWGWEHRDELATMANPIGYLYRVGQSSLARDHRRRQRHVEYFPEPIAPDDPTVDEELFDGLRRLTPDQRTAVVMVHMYGFSYREVAELTGVSTSAVTNHVHRGLARLRTILHPHPHHDGGPR